MRTLALLYAGALLGHSFIATPAKFLVSELGTGELLLVGRATFGVFVWCETALIGALLLAALMSRRSLAVVVLVAVLLGAQLFWLRPILDERVSEIIAGADPTPSTLHHLYALLELAKLAILLTVGTLPRRSAVP